MRRKDREMTEAFALSVVDKCSYGVLATVNADGTPYCVPLSIVRSGRFLYFHCAYHGQKIDNLKRNPQVCMTCVGDVHPYEDEFTTAYESAVVTGTAEELTNDAEKMEALQLLCQKYTPDNMHKFQSECDRSLFRTAVWKIRIESITGKAKLKHKEILPAE